MSENMNDIVSYRTTKTKKKELEDIAKAAGCHSLSEYARRRVEENESDGIRNIILFIQDLVLSCVSFNNVKIEAENLDPEKVKVAMDEYKVDIIRNWNEKNGLS